MSSVRIVYSFHRRYIFDTVFELASRRRRVAYNVVSIVINDDAIIMTPLRTGRCRTKYKI